MEKPEAPHRPEDITAEWVASVVTAGLGRPVAIDDVEIELIGGGFLGTVARIAIEAEDVDVPASLVAKFAHPEAQTRAEVWGAGVYQLEARFYSELRPSLPLRTPTPWFVETDRSADRHLIVLDDLSSWTLYDQLTGCPPERAFDVVTDLAALHRTFWGGGGDLASTLRIAADDQAWFELSESGIAATLERTDLSATQRRLTERYSEIGPRALAMLDEHRTVVHADARIENVFFAPDGTRTWIDWDGIQLGGGGYDLAYFMSQSLRVDDRRAIESDLIAHYVAELGRPDYGEREGLRDYRLGIVAGWSVALAVVGVYSATSDAAEALVSEGIARVGAALDDHDALAAFD